MLPEAGPAYAALAPNAKAKTSTIEAFSNIAKVSIGAGSFALPFAMREGGVVAGAVGLVVISIVSLYTMQLMLDLKRMAKERVSSDTPTDTYAELGDAIMPYGGLIVNTFVLSCNVGVSASYLVFIGDNLTKAINHAASTDWVAYDVFAFIVPIAGLLSWLSSFHLISRAAYAGFVFLVLAMAFTYIDGNIHQVPADDKHILLTDWTSYTQFFGVGCFLFCIHAVVFPVEVSMEHPAHMRSVLTWTCLTVLVVNLPFAIVGYIMFAQHTEQYIFNNLPQNTLLDTVQIALSLELLLTFPIALMPAVHIIEEYLAETHPFQRYPLIVSRVARSLLVALAWAMAVLVPNFNDILNLVGGLATAVLAFVLPPLFHVLERRNAKKTIAAVDYGHLSLTVCGIAAVAATTSVTIESILK